MKTRDNNTREHQHSMLPKSLKEPCTGGKATIVDSRPYTIHQRKLREAMHNSPRVTQLREMQEMMNNNSCVQSHAPLRATTNTYAASKALSIPRKTPKGSSRFQQIATTMGKQHGVDTSGLVATHNSSFPAKLNAEATIQGNNIHFAPGRDTDYNIRHEVAHAIDNTLHGMPKGDRVVNGQRIDTTREKIADRMAKEPTISLKDEPFTVQRKAHYVPSEIPGVTKTHGSYTSEHVIQRSGEQAAIDYVNDLGIRRGNRRQSIIDTEGHSQARTYFVGFYNMADLIAKLAENRSLWGRGDLTKKRIRRILRGNEHFLKPYLIEKIKAGNCDEFSLVVYKYLLEHTENQMVYRVHLEGELREKKKVIGILDHAFVITSPTDLSVEKEVVRYGNTIKVKRLKPEALYQSTVVDAWYHGKKMSLANYLQKGNHYKVNLTLDNIEIDNMEKANKQDRFTKEQVEFINYLIDQMDLENDPKASEKASEYLRRAKKDRDDEAYSSGGDKFRSRYDLL